MLMTYTETFMPLKRPLLPMRLFKIRNFAVAVTVGTVAQMVYYALNVLWPQQIAAVYTTDNIMIGWISVSLPLSVVCSNLICLSVYDWSILGCRRSHLRHSLQVCSPSQVSDHLCYHRFDCFRWHDGLDE